MSIELAYAAGLIDGEGCIGIYYNKIKHVYQLRISVEMVDHVGIDYLLKLFGGSYYYKEPKIPRREHHTWMIFSSKAEEVLTQLLPFLLVKKQQALTALTCKWIGFNGRNFPSEDDLTKREQASIKMRELNKRGFYG